MRAYLVDRHDNSPALKQISKPEPEADQVLIKISACGLNFADLLLASGDYQDIPPLPFALGMEVSGTVAAIGTNVDADLVGCRVAGFIGSGGLAEYAVIDAARIVELPDAVSFEQGAAFQIAYGTSHLALTHRARLQSGETLLVLGAAGGVGLTAVEVGKLQGAEVIAVARGTEKLEIAATAGADHLIDSDSEDIRDRVKALGGADVVYDPVGGEAFAAAFRACKPEARILTIGYASGKIPPIAANHMLVKNIDVIGFYWGGYLKFAPDVLTDSLKTLLSWLDSGKIKPHISHTLPLDQAAEGLELLRRRKATGKVIITP